MAGRPRIWQPFETVKWASGYEFTDDGRMRDRHGNVLDVGAAPDYTVRMRMYDRTVAFPRRDILALEFLGPPCPYRCVICDQRLKPTVVHLDQNPGNFARENLKWGPDIEARSHELNCIRWAMEWNHVPPRARTVKRDGVIFHGVSSMPKKSRVAAERRKDLRDVSPEENIPLLGVNEKPKDDHER